MDNERIKLIAEALCKVGAIDGYHPTTFNHFQRRSQYLALKGGEPVAFTQVKTRFGCEFIELTDEEVDLAVVSMLRKGYRLYRSYFHPMWPSYFMAKCPADDYLFEHSCQEMGCIVR